MTTQVRPYSKDLLYALRMRDVPGPRIAEVLAEVDSHVRETGEDPREAFGAPKQYAAEVSAALGNPGKPLWRHVFSRSTGFAGFAGFAGAWLLLDGVIAVSADERAVLGLPPVALILLGAALLLAVVAEVAWLARRPVARVLDPRSGAEMTPPVPRWRWLLWILALLIVSLSVATLLVSGVVAITQR